MCTFPCRVWPWRSLAWKGMSKHIGLPTRESGPHKQGYNRSTTSRIRSLLLHNACLTVRHFRSCSFPPHRSWPIPPPRAASSPPPAAANRPPRVPFPRNPTEPLPCPSSPAALGATRHPWRYRARYYRPAIARFEQGW